MAKPHPRWCMGTESAEDDHVSKTVHAARPTDCADIRLYLRELRDTRDDWRRTILVLEIMEDDNTETYPMPLFQAGLLHTALGDLLQGAKAPSLS